MLLLLSLNKRCSGSSLSCMPSSTLFKAPTRFLNLLKTLAVIMRRSRYSSSIDMTNEKPECSHDREI